MSAWLSAPAPDAGARPARLLVCEHCCWSLPRYRLQNSHGRTTKIYLAHHVTAMHIELALIRAAMLCSFPVSGAGDDDCISDPRAARVSPPSCLAHIVRAKCMKHAMLSLLLNLLVRRLTYLSPGCGSAGLDA
jgi:hypothetical protein